MPMTLNNSGSLKKLPASTLNRGHEKKDVWNELSNHLSLLPSSPLIRNCRFTLVTEPYNAYQLEDYQL